MSSSEPLLGLDAERTISELGLVPHPEGGFFRETFRARGSVPGPVSNSVRAASTAIYFLLRAGDFSAFHSVLCDEVWHFYLGATLELHTIDSRGRHQVSKLGPRLDQSERPQQVVPAGTLQAARVLGEGFALVGCTVAPGFDFSDFVMPARSALTERFPELKDVIEALTR